jgi:hypothetical protein
VARERRAFRNGMPMVTDTRSLTWGSGPQLAMR